MRFTTRTATGKVKLWGRRRAQFGQKRTSLLKLLRDYPDFQGRPRTLLAGALLGSRRDECREWAGKIEQAHRSATSAQFTSAALNAFASHLCINGRCRERLANLTADLDREALELAWRMAEEAAALPLDEALHFVTSLYPALLAPETRSKLGAFYTPPALTNRLVELLSEQGVDWSKARVLDPAAGAGAFLIAAARPMISALTGSEAAFVLRQLGARLRGLEIDPNAAVLGQAAIEILLAETIEAHEFVPQFIRVCDSLAETPQECFDVVLGNPPYGRVSLAADQRRKFARSLYGHANLYGLFTDVALRWTKYDGLIAFLTPTSVLSGQYFSSLRSLLAAEAPPVSIDFVHARKGVFEDVLQETMLAVYRRTSSAHRVQVHYLNVRDEATAEVVRNGTVALPIRPNHPWLAPRDPKHCALIANVEKMPTRLSDWGYEVSTGPLVWNRFKGQLHDGPAHRAFPLIWAEAVTADGRFVHRAQRRNHALYFRLDKGDDWLLVTSGCVLLQRTTAKEQPRRLIAAEMPNEFVAKHRGVVVENHLNMVRPTGRQPAVSPSVVAAVLNSRVVDEVFRCISGSVAVSAFELESLPLPGIEAMGPIDRLVVSGAGRTEVETAIAALYQQVNS